MDSAILLTLSLETLKLQLSEALVARHKLAIGNKAVDVAIGDQRTRFTETNVGDLDGYIAALHVAIKAKEGTRPAHAPIYVGYGGR